MLCFNNSCSTQAFASWARHVLDAYPHSDRMSVMHAVRAYLSTGDAGDAMHCHVSSHCEWHYITIIMLFWFSKTVTKTSLRLECSSQLCCKTHQSGSPRSDPHCNPTRCQQSSPGSQQDWIVIRLYCCRSCCCQCPVRVPVEKAISAEAYK